MRRARLVFILLCLVAIVAGCGAGREALPPVKSGVAEGYRIAVMPVDNLSGAGGAQVKELRSVLIGMLKEAGFSLLPDEELDRFMTRHRIRYVGGVDSITSRAFLDEEGINAVLVTTLELLIDTDPPKIALTSRLVSTGERPEIIWIDGVALSGDDHPGILDLGLVHDPLILRDRALLLLADSLIGQLAGTDGRAGAVTASGTFSPKVSYDAMFLKEGKKYTIGVLPFINLSEKRYAGEIMSLHFVRELAEMGDFTVLEPGIIRERLLNSRIIMAEGISKFELDVLSNSLGTDLMISGKVNRYLDLNIPGGVPKVEFSVLLLEGWDKRIVWSSISYNEGNDSVWFYDVGRISTAMGTATKMVRTLLDGIARGEVVPEEMKGKEKEEFDLFKLFRMR